MIRIGKVLIVVSVFFFRISSYATTSSLPEYSSEQPPEEYQETVDQINLELNQIRNESFCPGGKLVLSCGNGKCEPERGEDEETCPQDCSVAPVKSYDLQVSCVEVKRLAIPTSIGEVQDIVRDAVKKKMHIRVVGNRHSVNGQYCTDGVVISTEKLNQIIGLYSDDAIGGSDFVEVEPGVTLGELTDWLHFRGKSLGYAVMGFQGMTIGGAIATGAHGSSPHHSSVISSRVRSVVIVTPKGELVDVNEQTSTEDTLKAFRANLGMLGVVVRIRLAVVPQFNLHVEVTTGSQDELFKDNGPWRQVASCDYGQINWFPSMGRIVKTCGTETLDPAEPGASNTLLRPDIPKGLLKPYQLALHYGQCYHFIGSLLEKLRYLVFAWQPPFKKLNDKGRLNHTSRVNGYSHRLMSSPLITPLSGFSQVDWEFVIPLSQAQGAVAEIAKYIKDHQIHLPLVGVFLRFGISEDTTWLAHSASAGVFQPNEPVIFIEFPVPSPVGFSPDAKDALNETYEGLARILLTRYHARAHWGKNQDWVFQFQRGLISYGENTRRFQKVVSAFDPDGVFSNEFGKKAGIYE